MNIYSKCGLGKYAIQDGQRYPTWDQRILEIFLFHLRDWGEGYVGYCYYS